MTNEELAGLKNLFFYIGNLSHRAWDDPKNVRAVCERIESYAKQGQQKIDEIRRLGAAVSASPQPKMCCPKCGGEVTWQRGDRNAFCQEQMHIFTIVNEKDWQQFFAAAPANAELLCVIRINPQRQASGAAPLSKWTQRCNKCEWFDSWAGLAQEQPVDNNPQKGKP